jgi:hypothetical protein
MPHLLLNLISPYSCLSYISSSPLTSCKHELVPLTFCNLNADEPVLPRAPFPLVIEPLNMASPDEPTFAKKRIGRKRLPPLAPGPSIQFVVASHPDDFRDGATMRNVRSHVMYKHKERRTPSPPEKRKSREASKTPAAPTRTPSPMTSTSDGVLEDNNFLTINSTKQPYSGWNEEFFNYTSASHMMNPIRTLAARIISATTAAPARSAPAMFEQAPEFPFTEHIVLTRESLASLRQEHIRSTAFFCHGTFPCPSFMLGAQRLQINCGCTVFAKKTSHCSVMSA